VVNGIPKRGLVAGRSYWVLAESDVVGDLVGGTPPTKTHLGQAKYLAPFQVTTANPSTSGSSPFLTLPVCPIAGTGFLILGTSAEVSKTTAGLTVLRALLQKGHTT
jgi:hypothetical protein